MSLLFHCFCLLNYILISNGEFTICILGKPKIDQIATQKTSEQCDSILQSPERELFEYHNVEKREVVTNLTDVDITTDAPEETQTITTVPAIPDNVSTTAIPMTPVVVTTMTSVEVSKMTMAATTAATTTNSIETTESNATTTTTVDPIWDPDSGDKDEVIKVDGLNTDNTTIDHHRYYQSFSKHGSAIMPYWVDFDDVPEKVVVNKKLSSAYRQALNVPLSFEFPFYGHKLRNITIATGGFIYTGSFLHKWLAATQYIAPLMANFDTSASSDATVKYVDNGTALTVQWEKVVLQDNPTFGAFTFQVTIHKTGNIIFAYKDIPGKTSLIKDSAHPVKVGLSDAYIVEKTIFYIRKKTIYEYHKIDKKQFSISNLTAIIFEPLPNCVKFNTCTMCLTGVTNFKCEWCQQVGRCSDGLDRFRQDWLEEGCGYKALEHAADCASLPPITPKSRYSQSIISKSLDSSKSRTVKSASHVGIIITFIIVLLAICFSGWLYYAYFHPHTSAGQFLIKYRPSTWSCNRGGAKYTAATMHSIHM